MTNDVEALAAMVTMLQTEIEDLKRQFRRGLCQMLKATESTPPTVDAELARQERRHREAGPDARSSPTAREFLPEGEAMG